ncbi:antibiotic biosynthesis monooxygenase family protein [Pseudonocardia spinosispora]|uniref:antibiotic biosynthesis monooxygenase family protein n=1 Tax=Pseudonocardia spinosispora TaxID=103441 RepID=UPI0004024749|nr:antibiotic biosynthesis monooxygenase family protein [Pseudonocardia spinosispora]
MLTLVNTFVLTGAPDEFERIFTDTADFMSRQPGFLGAHLVRSTIDENTYFNVARWASREAFEAAAGTPQMREHRTHVLTVATPRPHPCTTVHVAAAAEGSGE